MIKKINGKKEKKLGIIPVPFPKQKKKKMAKKKY